MARFRLSAPAQADIVAILLTSERRHGRRARLRYQALLAATMRRVAVDPEGPATADRGALLAGLRSLHLRHGRGDSAEAPVARPVHAIYYRAVRPGLVEVVRVLHDRMDPGRQFGREDDSGDG